jgi:predicted negative regulator of RcsB-dependent stress response
LGWLDTHKKQVIQGLIGLTAVIVAVSFFVWWSNQKEQEASSALVMMQLEPLQPGVTPGERFKRFAAAHESTEAGTHALLLAGGALFMEGKYAEARASLEQFLARTSDSPFAVQASYGIAASLESENKLNEALVKYESIARLSREPLAERAKLAVARIHLAQNRPEEAFKLYQQLLGSGSGSDAQREAQLRGAELLKQHPEFAPTNTPSAALPAAAPVLQQ